MNIIVLGAAGFIGTNLLMRLVDDKNNKVVAVDENISYFDSSIDSSKVNLQEKNFHSAANFQELITGQDVVYHLISTNNPTSSNINIGTDIADNLLITVNILEACVAEKVKKIIFISSGGTVYGDRVQGSVTENDQTNPITTYGIQKLTIEKIIYLYHRMYGLNYSIVRLSNPYGPYQRPNGRLGAVTTFVYRALMGLPLIVYGDGTVVRDYIYIDDAIEGILAIAEGEQEGSLFNLGSGVGTSINEVIGIIKEVMDSNIEVQYRPRRTVDVPVNILNISKYKKNFGEKSLVDLRNGICRTRDFLMTRLGYYDINC